MYYKTNNMNLTDWIKRRVVELKKEYDVASGVGLQDDGALKSTLDAIRTGGKIEGYGEVLEHVKKNGKSLNRILLDVMNLGMTLRQDQLSGHGNRSGNEVLAEWIEKNLWNAK